MPAAAEGATCGELWATYEVEFFKPKALDPTGRELEADHFQLSGTFAGTSPLERYKQEPMEARLRNDNRCKPERISIPGKRANGKLSCSLDSHRCVNGHHAACLIIHELSIVNSFLRRHGRSSGSCKRADYE